uniref:Uncharacterized protein n=1 Tax=Candidatus Nitrotoga fabula TaxID=2182327 RepID=A0A2X0RD09_9PROT|nr:protein of unknown function [Candidatus Nitrotoga fabula]
MSLKVRFAISRKTSISIIYFNYHIDMVLSIHAGAMESTCVFLT